ncbi:MAG: DUF563 domain-containing protein, partial [Flavobacteriales bacterium]|nr:DUF563 domain-containing protein [Flavobacteriales bacterium]
MWLIERSRALLSRCAITVFQGTKKPIIGGTCRLIIWVMGRRPGELGTFHEKAIQKFDLLTGSKFETKTPTFSDAGGASNHGQFPAIQAYHLQNATISTDTVNVAVETKLLSSPYRLANLDRVPFNATWLGYVDGNTCILPTRENRAFESGILIDGDGGSNWYHFLIECLPKAWLSERLPAHFDDYPLIVPPNCSSVTNFSKAIALFSGSRTVIHAEQAQRVGVKDLIVIDDVVRAPFNLYRGLWPIPSEYSQHDDFLRDYAREIRLRLGVCRNKGNQPSRIFLQRPGSRRDYNQDA